MTGEGRTATMKATSKWKRHRTQHQVLLLHSLLLSYLGQFIVKKKKKKKLEMLSHKYVKEWLRFEMFLNQGVSAFLHKFELKEVKA